MIPINKGSGRERKAVLTGIKSIPFKKIFCIIFSLIFVAILVFNSFYIVDTDQIGVVYTLGNPTATTGPGSHLKAPFFQTVTKSKNPQAVIPIYLGYRDMGSQEYEPVPREAVMITSDENLLDIEWMVEVSISDANKAMYRCSDPIEYIRAICLSNMRALINTLPMDTASTVGREKLSATAFPVIDKHLKEADIGYMIKNIRIQDVQPPQALTQAYSLVNTAQQKKAEEINKARAEKAQVINAKQSDIAKRKAAADAETNRIVNSAKGEVSEYFAMYNLYSKNKPITKSQMLMNMLENMLPKAKIYILDDGGATVRYINLDQLKPESQAQFEPQR